MGKEERSLDREEATHGTPGAWFKKESASANSKPCTWENLPVPPPPPQPLHCSVTK